MSDPKPFTEVYDKYPNASIIERYQRSLDEGYPPFYGYLADNLLADGGDVYVVAAWQKTLQLAPNELQEQLDSESVEPEDPIYLISVDPETTPAFQWDEFIDVPEERSDVQHPSLTTPRGPGFICTQGETGSEDEIGWVYQSVVSLDLDQVHGVEGGPARDVLMLESKQFDLNASRCRQAAAVSVLGLWPQIEQEIARLRADAGLFYLADATGEPLLSSTVQTHLVEPVHNPKRTPNGQLVSPKVQPNFAHLGLRTPDTALVRASPSETDAVDRPRSQRSRRRRDLPENNVDIAHPGGAYRHERPRKHNGSPYPSENPRRRGHLKVQKNAP
ncbi:hypothetical protein SCP_0601960 [Sparassis crispa]|uniref:Uncharacterized protein n=1 Tax=Sparassis crispa TaxID=139825 RepID=A0A401GPS1_9APHY|nr:hypothetical protein SCP_0601960 [Sparassis crispa]GBE84218.1 hypothetical protein SCP_0601960 [Sparassis crispa]